MQNSEYFHRFYQVFFVLIITVMSSMVCGVAIESGSGVVGVAVALELRQSIANELNVNNQIVRGIITDGEDDEHMPGFLQRFKDQDLWLDTVLSGTQDVPSDDYEELIKKQARLRDVVSGQRKADEFLDGISKKLKIRGGDYKKIRLFSLYELNARVQKWSSPVEFSDKVIEPIVLGVIGKVTGQSAMEAAARLGLYLKLARALEKFDTIDKQLKEARENLDRVKLEFITAADEVIAKKL